MDLLERCRVNNNNSVSCNCKSQYVFKLKFNFQPFYFDKILFIENLFAFIVNISSATIYTLTCYLKVRVVLLACLLSASCYLSQVTYRCHLLNECFTCHCQKFSSYTYVTICIWTRSEFVVREAIQGNKRYKTFPFW